MPNFSNLASSVGKMIVDTIRLLCNIIAYQQVIYARTI